ncbi:hypothetical protein ACP4OV_030535 [Aristida adscensionis]
MARWLPPPPPGGAAQPLGHENAIALSFFLACVAATLALTSSMCSACGRRTKPDAASDQSASAADAGNQKASATDDEEEEEEEEEVMVTLSPELATHGPIDAVALPSTTSKRRVSLSLRKNLSVNIPDKMRLSRRDRREHKAESEDTLWKKGIILGEKCRIPGERDGELADDPVDGLAAESFRRSSYSRPISRSNSFAGHHHRASLS